MVYPNYFDFQFSYLHTFYKPNNIKTEPAQKLKLIFKFSTIKGQINVPIWPIQGIKDEEKMEKL